MKKRALTLILLLSSLFYTSCSYSVDFVVINESGDPVTVEYELKRVKPCERPYCLWDKPAIKTVKDLGNSDIGWKDLSQGSYVYDEQAGKVKVVLRPEEALRVGELINFSHGENADESFNIKTISLKGTRGTAYYEGTQAQFQFKEENTGLYVIRFY